MKKLLLLFVLCSVALAQGPVWKAAGAVTYWDSESKSYKPAGASSVIFSRMDAQHVTDVSDASWSALTLAAGFKEAGVVVSNQGSTILMVTFDLASTATGAAYDTFYVAAGTSMLFPINADTLYAKEATSAPELEIQQGKVDY